MRDVADMPYRACVAVMMFNAHGEVWLGRRVPKWDNHLLDMPWQCPQGGIDPGETPQDAAIRELREEVGCSNVALLAESQTWHNIAASARNGSPRAFSATRASST